MKHSVLLLIMGLSFGTSAQWISLPKNSSYIVPPNNQFMVNPYTNDLWFVRDQDASVILNDGTVVVFDTTDLGLLWQGSTLRFAFTSEHTYFSKDQVGLYTFDNFVKQPLWGDAEITDLTTDEDTLFIVRNGNFYKFSDNSGLNNSNILSYGLKSQNGYLYIDAGSVAHVVGGSLQYFLTDPHYLIASLNSFNFKRYSDTLYAASEKGISVGYNYDFIDTITPYNTTNMPSSNVLEMRFDLNDALWAIFGNAAGTPIALAKLEGNNWTSIFTAANSPINFSQYKGFDIDTLGNLWLVDGSFLHTLSSPTNPAWLSTFEQRQLFAFNIFPNPSNDHFSIELSENVQPTAFRIVDLAGQVQLQRTFEPLVHHRLSNGVYIVELLEENTLVGQRKLVVQ